VIFLAQSTQPVLVVQEDAWRFWLLVILETLTFTAGTILVPSVRAIWSRLGRGDDKFDDQAQKLTRLETHFSNLSEDVKQGAAENRDLLEKINDNFVEERGGVERLRAEMLKDCATKNELKVVEQKMDEQHREVMRAIREQGGRR
jgi:predicted transcriptional regulator